ncbi:MAG TPA: carboxypeptidase-like regulatory domain-containing protein, partial [Terracidiphilus sp.]|nr:carboxypeptidase-like regulatory domain-containing protein [Terracidiphilus sp.]
MALATLALHAQNPPSASQSQPPEAAAAQEPGKPDPALSTPAAPADPATIAGTVLDATGAEVQDAHVLLATDNGVKVDDRRTGSDGEFEFPGLAAGAYQLKISGPGLGTVRRSIQLQSGDFHILSKLRLPMLATSSVVRVYGDPEEISIQQMHIAEQQRVLGVFPNFYASYDWNAPPMLAKQKYQLALRSLVDPVTFLSVGAIAGIEQYNNNFPGYGQGMKGYAKRYGAAYADDVSGRMLGNALLPAIFHQDPRYFYKGTGSLHARFFYALEAAVIARGDNGRSELSYSHILGSFA